MSTQLNGPTRDLRAIAERLLSARFGGPIRIGDSESLQERPTVYRLPVLDGPPDAPKSVVVKQPPPDQRYDPDASGFPAPTWFLFNHWAGLRFLSDVVSDGTLAPRCYAADRAAGLVLMEDLGPGPALDDLLLGDDPEVAEAALLELATSLGRMHALTIGKEPVYDRIREALGPHPKETDFYRYEWLAAAFDTTVRLLDITPSPSVHDDLATLIAVLRDPGPFRAYTHGDPCPDNVLSRPTGMRLIDFDVSGFRHALTEGVYGRIHFPTCWCVNRIPDPIVLRMEAVYRAALMVGCPEAADDREFYRAVVIGCAYWLLSMCHFTPLAALLENDEDWGIATLRQRYLLRSDILVRAAEEFDHLQTIGATFQVIAAKLRTRWPSAADAMPYYPAFR